MKSISGRKMLLPVAVLSLFVLITACEPSLQAFKGASITQQAQNAVDVLPSDVSYVGMLNTQELKENSFTDVMSNDLLDNNDAEEAMARLEDFIEATGFDPYEDMKEVYVAMDEVDSNGKPQVSVVAYASIDPELLTTYVQEEVGNELTLRSYRGVDVFEIDEDGAPSFSFVNEDMMLAASTSGLLENMIDRLEGEGSSLSDNSEMMGLVSQATAGQSAWMIAKKPEDGNFRSSNAANDLQEQAEQIWMAIDYAVMALNIESDGLDGQVFFYPNENVSADDLSSLMNGMVALAKINPDLEDKALDMLDDIRAKSSGDHVQIGMFVENEMLEEIK